MTPAGRVARCFLYHGVDADGSLVAVDAVGRGRTALACPYCATGLIARKGRVLAAHFAHAGATCRESRERAAGSVPLYDDFTTLEPLERADLRLCAQLLHQPINHTSLRGWRRAALGRLVAAGLLEEVPRGERWVNGVGSYRHSAWGEQVVAATRGRLSLGGLARVQERAAIDKLDRLEEQARSGDEASVLDLRLYRARLARLFSLDLYLIRVRADGARLHKIGVTARPVDERLPEIRRDLEPHCARLELEVAGHWARRGSLELYFKRVFARRQVKIGPLTEYFSLERDRRALRELGALDSALPARLQALLQQTVAPADDRAGRLTAPKSVAHAARAEVGGVQRWSR